VSNESAVPEEDQLRLQRMETKLVEGLYANPGLTTRREEHWLRYGLSLARLDTFQPGAARQHARTERPDVRVRTSALTRWRKRVLAELEDLLLETDARVRIAETLGIYRGWIPQLHLVRQGVLEEYENDFAPRELDQELGTKALVTVAGGGGGAGYVYLGA